MKTVKDIRLIKQETDTVICNICGEMMCQNPYGYFDEHLSVTKNWGYGSDFDGETHRFDLCEGCYKKLIEHMKIAPEVE